jgi:hypothetical protein
LTELDEQLFVAARDSGIGSTEITRAAEGQAETPSSPFEPSSPVAQALPECASLMEVMRSVQLDTMRNLGIASLQPLRAALANTSRDENEELWARYHVILGAALRARAGSLPAHRRARLLIEATRAFDEAFGVYATRGAFTLNYAGYQAQERRESCRPFGDCVGERDGTALVALAIAGPANKSGGLLKRAVTSLRLARAGADIKSWAWVSTTNNLACALTLLGKRSPGPVAAALLREATHVLQEALKAPCDGLRREDRASTLINLAEALLSSAERETPGVRVKKIERALMASSVALLSVVPADLGWLVKLQHRELN